QFPSTPLFDSGPAASRTSRFGATAPSVPAAASVWQAPQFVWKRRCAVLSLPEIGWTAALGEPRFQIAQAGIPTRQITAMTAKMAKGRFASIIGSLPARAGARILRVQPPLPRSPGGRARASSTGTFAAARSRDSEVEAG